MYFSDTNKKTTHNRNKKFNKIYILLGIVILIGLTVFNLLPKKNENNIPETINYLEIEGDNIITIYKGSEYIEPGYQAYNSDNVDLSKQVVIKSNLNINELGEYEIIYKLNDIQKTRKVIVVETPKEYTFLNLKSVGEDPTIYLNIGEEYVEPGYEAFNSSGDVLTDMVQVDNNVDTSKKGFYLITYSITDIYGVVITKTRDVVVMDMNIKLSLSNNDYTNSGVEINIEVEDDYFSYIILPNNTKITDKVYQYIVTENGTYTFMVYNTFGSVKSASIQVNNVDKIKPSGSCTIEQFNDYSSIKINASDNIGIDRYIYNNKEYLQDSIKVSSSINSAQIKIYDRANNYIDINCKLKHKVKVYISNIKNDGVIVTVNAKKVDSNISGYYFSYTNQIPSKSTGGYISTNLESIDVVRLPGTTYVWVEDAKGNISQAASITLSNDVLVKTLSNNKYTILKGTTISAFLSNKGWSIEEFNKLIYRSVRAAGVNTKKGAATSAVALVTVLAQKYNIKIPYRQGGKTQYLGLDPYWGQYKANTTYPGNDYYGIDCDGLVNWSYRNAGIEYSNFLNLDNHYYYWSGITYNKNNGEIGDILRRTNHVNIIIGKTSEGYIVAEGFNTQQGVVINTYPYSDTSGYTIIKGERLFNEYTKMTLGEYPKGF